VDRPGGRLGTIVLAILLTACVAVAALAQEKKPIKSDDPKADKIHIQADRLISDSAARYAEFTGNVRATQGTTIITADRLKIAFKKNSEGAAKSDSEADSVDTITASGNVKIHFDNRTAEAEQAVYQTATRVIVLTGAESRISSGRDYITGSKITYDRTSGRIDVVGSSAKPVEALFYSGEKALN
jgi:lipopolysaccharide export system protein LptA